MTRYTAWFALTLAACDGCQGCSDPASDAPARERVGKPAPDIGAIEPAELEPAEARTENGLTWKKDLVVCDADDRAVNSPRVKARGRGDTAWIVISSLQRACEPEPDFDVTVENNILKLVASKSTGDVESCACPYGITLAVEGLEGLEYSIELWEEGGEAALANGRLRAR